MVQQQQTRKIFHLDDTYLEELDCRYFGLGIFRTFQPQSLVIFSSSAVLFHICRFLDAKLLRKIECCFKTVSVLTVKPQTKMRKKHAHFSFHPRMKAKLLFSVMFLTSTIFFTVPWNRFPVESGLNSTLTLFWVGGWTLPQEGTPWSLLQAKSFYESMLSTTVADTSKYYRGDETWGRWQQAILSWWLQRHSVSLMLGQLMWWPWQWQLFFTGHRVCLHWKAGCHYNRHTDVRNTCDTAGANILITEAVFVQAMAFQILLQNCYQKPSNNFCNTF